MRNEHPEAVAAWPSAQLVLADLALWFEKHRRKLPWRAEDLSKPHPDPYAVIISEFMLQQTQVNTVVPYYQRWMEAFPDLQHLAQSPEDRVLKSWEGLGYYRRARSLHQTAGLLAQRGWPNNLEGLLRCPGLGPYSAAAVGAIAFQWPTPALDGNAFRVLSRLLLLEGEPQESSELLRSWLKPALVAHGPSRLTQAIMELGATHCKPHPECPSCPLVNRCETHVRQMTDVIPIPRPRKKIRHLRRILIAAESSGGFYLQPPEDKGLLAGLWQWPSRVPAPAEEPEKLLLSLFPMGKVLPLASYSHTYTHLREELLPYRVENVSEKALDPGLCWVPIERLDTLPMGRRDSILRSRVLQDLSMQDGILGSF